MPANQSGIGFFIPVREEKCVQQGNCDPPPDARAGR